MPNYLPVVIEARATAPASLAGDGAAARALAIVEEVAARLAPLGYALLAAAPGAEAASAGVRVDAIADPVGTPVRVLEDPLDRAQPVWVPEPPDPAGVTAAVSSELQATLTARLDRPDVRLGVVTVAGRGFAASGQPRPWRLVNALGAVGRWRAGADAQVTAAVDEWIALGADAVRVAATLWGPSWDGTLVPADGDLTVTPVQLDSVSAIVATVEALTARGLLVVLTLCGPGALTTPGLESYDARDGWVQGITAAVSHLPGVVLEIAYTPTADGWDGQEPLAHLARVRSTDPRRLAAYGAETGTAAGRQADARTGHWLSVHADRSVDTRTRPWGWITALAASGYRPATASAPVAILQSMTFGEGAGVPAGWTERGDAQAYAYGVVGGIRGWQAGYSSIATMRVQPAATRETSTLSHWLAGVRVPVPGWEQADRLFVVTGDQVSGESPLAAVSAADTILGRHDGADGLAVVLAAQTGWVACPRPGWSVETLHAAEGVRLVRVGRR